MRAATIHLNACGRSGFSRVSKVKITAWVDERTASMIKGLAAQQGVSVSELCAELLRRGVEEDAAGGVGAEVLLPAVRASVRREVGRVCRGCAGARTGVRG